MIEDVGWCKTRGPMLQKHYLATMVGPPCCIVALFGFVQSMVTTDSWILFMLQSEQSHFIRAMHKKEKIRTTQFLSIEMRKGRSGLHVNLLMVINVSQQVRDHHQVMLVHHPDDLIAIQCCTQATPIARHLLRFSASRIL